MSNDYPSWICRECAIVNGGSCGKNKVSTHHINKCAWCGQEKSVTHVRNWGYPNYSMDEKISGFFKEIKEDE